MVSHGRQGPGGAVEPCPGSSQRAGLVRGPAAVDGEHVPGDVAGGVRGQEQQRPVDLGDVRHPPQQGPPADPLPLLGVGELAGQRGREEPGRQRVDADAAWRPIARPGDG